MEMLLTAIKKKFAEKTQRHQIKRVLLIDGDKDRTLSNALQKEGYDVVRCDSVGEAWNLVYPHRPHLIILTFDNSSRSALSDFQECQALAEGVPIVLAAAGDISGSFPKNLRHGTEPVLATWSTSESVRAALHGLEDSTTKI